MTRTASVVPVTVLGPVSAGTIAWRARGALHLTVVVKGTFALVPDGRMTAVAPEPIAAAEQPHPTGLGLLTAGDLAPYLPKPEIWLVGHAAVPPQLGQPSLLVDLKIAQGGAVQMGKRLELDVARATGNPPAVRVAATGPMSADWPLRSRWLEGIDRRRLSRRVLDIPDMLSWEYFQTAPADQRLDELRGDEMLLLGGMVAGRPRLWTQLPVATGAARVYRRSAAAPRAGDRVPLWPDTLQVDVDRQRCSILWRGRVPLSTEEELDALHVVVGLEQPGQAVAWTDPFETEDAARRASSSGVGETMWFSDADVAAFAQAQAALAAPPAADAPADIPYSDTATLTTEDLGKLAQQLATPFKAATSRPKPTLSLERSPFAPPSAQAPPAPAAPLEPAFSGTNALTTDDLKKIAEQSTTPFKEARSRPKATLSLDRSPVAPPAPVASTPAPPGELAFSGTSALTPDDLQRISELSATPFEQAGIGTLERTVPAPLPPAPPPPLAALALSPPAASLKASPVMLSASPAELAFASTSALTLDDIKKISTQAAVPFAKPEPGAPVAASAALPSMPIRATPREDLAFSGTGALTTDDLRKVALQTATPFAAPGRRADADPADELTPDGMGAEFLAAMAEAGALA